MRLTPVKLLLSVFIIGGLMYVVNTTNVFSLLASVIVSTTLPNNNSSLESGLVGHWTFDGADISGTTALDSSGQGNNGTLTNGPTPTMGQIGQGLNFDGVDDYLRVASLDNTNFPQNGTLSFWIKADLASQDSKGVFDNYSAINHIFVRTCATNMCSGVSTQGLQVAFQDPSTYVFVRTLTVQNNEWAHVVVVWDTVNDMGYVYLNGVLVSPGSGSITDPAWVPNQERAYIGGVGGSNFNGKLDDTRIYERPLSADEIWQLYHQGKPDEISSPESQGDTLAQGLAGYWKLDDASGTSAADASGNGNTGTLTNGPTWTLGKIVGAVDFDGTNDYIDAGNGSALSFAGDITISAWIKPSALGDYKFYLSKYGGSNLGFDLGVMANGRVVATFRDGTNTDGFSSTGLIQSGVWQHVVVVQDVSTCYVRIYKDGALATTLTNQRCFINPSNTLTIGSRNGTGLFAGSMDEVRIYNRELSDDEIANLYKTTNPTEVDMGLVGHWTFDGADISGTTVYDRSGKNNSGTLTNGPVKTIGQVGQAVKFDGVNDYVNIPNSSNLNPGTGNFTISAWVKIDSTPNDYTRFINKGSGANYYALVKFPSDKWKFEFRDGILSTADIDFGVGTISYGKWMHVVTTVNASSSLTSGYLDGVLKDTSSTAGYGSVTNTDYLSVGRETALGAAYTIDEVRIYNRALSADEIKSLYTKGAGSHINTSQNIIPGSTLQNGLIGLWSFDGPDVSGVTSYDRSGQGNNGTLTNGPVPTIGKVGQGMKFDGVNDLVDLGSPAVLDNMMSGPGSLSAWVRPISYGQNSQGRIFDKASGADRSGGWSLLYNISGSLLAFEATHNTSGMSRTISGLNTPLGEWTHLIVTWDGTSAYSGVHFYINGTEPTYIGGVNGVGGPVDDSANTLRIGGFSTIRAFDGTIDEARIYNRVLSVGEVQQLYQLGR